MSVDNEALQGAGMFADSAPGLGYSLILVTRLEKMTMDTIVSNIDSVAHRRVYIIAARWCLKVS